MYLSKHGTTQASEIEELPDKSRQHRSVTTFYIKFVPTTSEDDEHASNLMESMAIPWHKITCKPCKLDGRKAIQFEVSVPSVMALSKESGS